MPVKKCEVCGSEFQARLSKIRTCSFQCRNTLISTEKSARYQKVKQCEICGKDFNVGASDAKKRTCSDECGYKLRGSLTSTSQTMRCVTCGRDFLVTLSQLATMNGGTYCSQKCMYGRNKSRTERACVCCGKMFTSPPSQMHVMTCSIECGYKWFSGERRVNYIGATSRVTKEDGTVVTRQQRWYASKKNTERRLLQERATPPWVDLDLIREFYDLAARTEALTGERYHVDHIVPLNGKTVSGLHNQFNLQILPWRDNLSKGNRHWPDKP